MSLAAAALILAAGLAVALAVALVRLRGAVRERRRAEAEARRALAAAEAADARHRNLLDDVPAMALRVDGAGRVLDASRLARERFPFLARGVPLLEAFGDHELAGRAEAALVALEPSGGELRLFAGGRRTYRVSVVPRLVNEAREALVVLSDASEAVAYQELRSQFVANVSHELRTPLTGLRGLLEALDDPGMDRATHDAFVARAAAETQRLEALISDILLLSELEAGEAPPSDRSDLAAAVLATVEELEAGAAAQGVSLRTRVEGPAWTPLTERMAHTVARNLVENAVRYAGPGATAEARVELRGDAIALCVADDGAGIPERHLPHVFERFYRADPSRSRRLGGTGLGLSIVKHIAERAGGRAEASSREGFGTEVTVTLPRAHDAPEAARP
jgi:two-component system, OmpR family, phosphate regulon sensor histidine kinase PhoR